MCDELDEVEDRRAAAEEFDRRNRLTLAERAAARPARTSCEDCDEPLPPIRQQYRCQRCVDCQEVLERRNPRLRRTL